MARLKRQELKHDEFVDTLDELLLYVEEHGRMLLSVALVMVLGGGGVGALYWHSRQQEQKANAALGTALLTFEAPVQEGLPPLPGEGPQKTFPSDREKYEAAEKEFAAVSAEFPRTRAARIARTYQAVCQFETGETAAALATLEELGGSRDASAASLARLFLAGYYEKLGRAGEAEKLYQELADRPTTTVPRATALLALANLKAASDPAAARQLLEQVRSDYPGTPIATEVSRRLELLPAPPPAEPATPTATPASTSAEPPQPKQP